MTENKKVENKDVGLIGGGNGDTLLFMADWLRNKNLNKIMLTRTRDGRWTTSVHKDYPHSDVDVLKNEMRHQLLLVAGFSEEEIDNLDEKMNNEEFQELIRKKLAEQGDYDKPREINANNGFVTALGLFYGHHMEVPKMGEDYSTIIYCAREHLNDIEYPQNLSPTLKANIEFFVDYVSRYADKSFVSKERTYTIFNICKKLLMMIDETVFGLDVEVYEP